MKATTVCVCFTILVSFALTIVGFPENSVRDDGETIPEHQLTALNIAPAAIEERSAIPIYNPAIAFERDENHRAKRHLFKKKKAKKGGYQQQQPSVIIVNQYQQPSYHKPQYVQPHVQNHGWGWRR